MAGTINVSGLVSNNDWAKVITDTIAAEKTAAETPYTTSKKDYQTKLSAIQAFNLTLQSIVDFIKNSSLDKNEGYDLYTSSLTSTDSSVTASDVLNASVGSSANIGNYSIEVTNIAQAEKISSDNFTSATDQRHLTGDLVINNKKVTLQDTDNLLDIAARINDANAGVVATVLSISDNQYRLMLESATTGTAGMSLKNGSSADLFEGLQLHTTTAQLAHASGLDALSDTYASKTSAIKTALGLTTGETGTIQLRGTDDTFYSVNINLSTDTLEGIAAKINTTNSGAAIPGVTASVEEVSEAGSTRYRLKLTNVDVSDLQDDRNLLETLGVTENTVPAANILRTGEDAALKIDSYSVTSSSNTITTAIPGVTLNLTGTNTGKPVNLQITQDATQLSKKITSLVTNLNTALSYIKDQNTYSADSAPKPLMGDVGLSSVRSSIMDALYKKVSANTLFANASSVGISYQKDLTIGVDTTKLTNALSTNRQEVINVLKGLGDNLRQNLNAYVDPYTGSLTYMKTSIQDSIKRIDKKIADLEDKFDKQKTLLEQRYNALEVLISSSNLTKNWLTQQVNYMTGKKE